MAEKPRICLGCGKRFNSVSASNRFCKPCKKKRRKLNGSFQALDTSFLPPMLMQSVSSRYYEKPPTTIVEYRSETAKAAFRNKIIAPLVTEGPSYPKDI